MTEKEKQILETFKRAIPTLSDLDKERLLSFGEGLGFKTKEQPPEPTAQQKPKEKSA